MCVKLHIFTPLLLTVKAKRERNKQTPELISEMKELLKTSELLRLKPAELNSAHDRKWYSKNNLCVFAKYLLLESLQRNDYSQDYLAILHASQLG